MVESDALEGAAPVTVSRRPRRLALRRRLGVLSRNALVLAPAILLAACAPKVTRFVVVPSHVCSGTPVKLSLEVKGKPTLTTEPVLAPGPGGTYNPIATTHFVLSVRRWPRSKPVGSETEVRVFPGAPPEPDEITASVTCHDGIVSGVIDRPSSEWDPRLLVRTVSSGEDRDLDVAHAGRAARLTAQDPTSNAFDGTSPAGAWTLSSRLRAGETCGAAAVTLLNVSAELRCQE